MARAKAVADERDKLREIAENCEALAESCAEAHESLVLAIDTLSKYA